MVSKIDQMSVLFFDVFFLRGTVSVHLILKHNGSRDEATAGQAQKLTLHAPFCFQVFGFLFFEVKMYKDDIESKESKCTRKT